MAKTLFLISSLLTLGIISTSCGTYAGVGRDLQKMGRNMEDSEARHPLWFFKLKKKPRLDIPPSTPIPAPTQIPTPVPQGAGAMPPAYPSYPEYPEDPIY